MNVITQQTFVVHRRSMHGDFRMRAGLRRCGDGQGAVEVWDSATELSSVVGKWWENNNDCQCVDEKNSQYQLLFKLGRVTLMHSFGNMRSKYLELRWC